MAIKSRVDVFVGNVLQWLGGIYATWAQALFEYLDNSVDAGARNIWFVLTPDAITVIDDGHGMNGPMDPDDYGLLSLFKEGMYENTLAEGDDIRAMVRTSSLRSLQWLAEAVGLSAKVYDPDHPLRGTKGIGTLAFRMVGNQAYWVSRPTVEVADGDEVQTWIMIVPSNQALSRGDVEAPIDVSPTPLIDPDGNRLESGTMVHITDLRGEPAKNLQPTYLLGRLVGRYGDAVARGVNIYLVDRMTKEGQATRGGIVHKVIPRKYPGVEVYSASHGVGGKKALFSVELYFNPEGRGLRPMLRRHGADVSELTSVPGLNIAPFNSGRIAGYIEFPQLSDAEAPWNSDKTAPLESQAFQEWLTAVQRVAEHVLENVTDIQKRAHDEHLEMVAHKLSEVAQSVLQESPLFEGLVKRVETTRRQVVRRGTRKTKPHKRTEVVVQNQHNQGIPGLTVTLSTISGKDLADRVTGVTGQISFGELSHGQYMVTVSGVPDITDQDVLTRYFRISARQERERIVFKLNTDMHIPHVNKIPGNLKIRAKALPDPMQPWDISRLVDGMLFINTENPYLKEALVKNDFPRQIDLITQFVAAAVVEFLYEAVPAATSHELLLRFTEFYNDFLQSMEGLEKDPELTGKRRKKR